MNDRSTRRNFLLTAMGTMGAIAGTKALSRQKPQKAEEKGTLPEKILGKTGLKVPIFGLGGAGKTPLSWEGREKEAREIIEAALQSGIRYFDTAASYGPSEDYLGKVLPAHRSKVIIATKTGARDRDGAWRQLEASLKRLKTDYLDIWQLHSVSFTEELERIFGRNGATKAIEEAKAQKIIRFSGITGHHEPAVIAEGLRRYPFDTTLISLNAADSHHPRPFRAGVLPTARERNVGVIAMKVPAYGRIFQPGGLTGMEQAMGYVLSLDGVHSCIIAAENVEQLRSNVAVARRWQPLEENEMRSIEQRVANIWQDNTFFRQWT